MHSLQTYGTRPNSDCEFRRPAKQLSTVVVCDGLLVSEAIFRESKDLSRSLSGQPRPLGVGLTENRGFALRFLAPMARRPSMAEGLEFANQLVIC